MKVGDSAELTRTFSRRDVLEYCELSGHEHEGQTVPEPMIGALFSCLLGIELPGLGTNYLKQETRFRAGAVIGEPLIARVEVTRLRPDKHLVDLATTCSRPDGSVVAGGRALVYVGDVAGNGNVG